jgi:PAS domain S-box-containing protein
LVLDRDGTVAYLNERTRELLQPHQGDGMHAQVEGRHFRDLDVEIYADDGEQIEPEEGTLQQVVETGEPVFGVRRELRWPTGHRQTISLNAAPLLDDQGEVREVVFSMEDVTERRYAESLRHSQRRILEQIANGTDLDAVLHSIVEMMEDLRPSLKASVLLVEDGRLHHGAAPSLPEAFVDRINGVEIGPEVGACGTAAHRGEEVLSRSIQDDPRWTGYKEIAAEHDLRACWSIPLWNDEKEVIGTLAFYWPRRRRPDEKDEQLARTAAKLAGIAIDRDRSERELRESEAHFQQLAENIEEVFWLRTQQKMLYVSPAFETISGRSREALRDDPSVLVDIVHPDDAERVREAYERGWEEGKESDGPLFDEEYRIVRPSGEVRWVHSVAWSYTIGDDGELRQAGYAVDVTEQVERRQELVAAKQEAEELNRLKTAFLANMSHEIRTPLTSIIGFAEILQDELGDEHGRAPELIHAAGERLMNTLDSVLQLSRLEADAIRLRPKQLDVCEEARETMVLFEQQAEKSDVALSIETPPSPQMACADPSALQRVLQNLIGNAVKFTEEGRVTVRVAPTSPPDGAAESGEAGWVCVEVEDTGVGISDDFLPNVYEAFEQESTGTRRSHEGSGLGLTVVKRLVELMDGVVGVESERGEGTTFRVYLPGECGKG